MEENESTDILTELKQQLEKLDIPVYYGAGDKSAFKYSEFIVFGRSNIRIVQHKTAYTKNFEIVIVAENWVRENLIQDVIKMAGNAGVRVSNGAEIVIDYQTKNDLSYEIVSIPFFVAEKVEY